MDSIVYEGDAIKYILNGEGTYQYGETASQNEYQYHLKDHLGNTRVVVNQNGKEIQQSAYYPFGLAFMQTINSDNKYLYNGKELQDDKLNGVKLDWYDYGARMYDAALGRWFVVDPLAEKYSSQSTYHFSGNNPVRFVDPNGMNYHDYRLNQDGSIEFVKPTQSATDDLYATKNNGTIDKNKSVSVTKGTFSNKIEIEPIAKTGGGCTREKIIGEGEGYQINNSTDAAKVFTFASENAPVEFGLIETSKSGSVVMTNRTSDKVNASKTANKMDGAGNTVTTITHSHPKNSDPSPTDKSNAGRTSHGRAIGYNVYQPGTKTVVGYDNNTIQFRLTKTMVWDLGK